MGIKDELSDLLYLAKTKGTANRWIFICVAIMYFIATPLVLIATIVALFAAGTVAKIVAGVALLVLIGLDVASYLMLTKN